MTIIDTDIISVVTPTMDDKKSLGLDLSESLFDYDLLLSDVNNNSNSIPTITVIKDNDSLFESLFHDENGEASDNSSNSLSPPTHNIKRPRIMQWGPHDGHESTTIVSIVLEHTEVTAPMKIVFGSMAVETAQHQHRMSTSGNDGSVWITLAASVPPLSDTRSKSNQIQLSVCLFDHLDPDLAIDTWDIGQFTYRDMPEEIHNNYRKRALSCEPDDNCAQKKTTFDTKQDESDNHDDVDSQLLKLLAPYDPLLTVSSTESSHSNLVSTPQSATHSVSWMSSPMDNQQSYTQANSANSPPFPTTTTTTNTMHQHGLVINSRPCLDNVYNNQQQPTYLSNMPPKQDMYRNYLEMQQHSRQPYLMQQQHHHLMTQAMSNYMNNSSYNSNQFTHAPTSSAATAASNNYNGYNMTTAEHQKQNLQQFQRVQQQQQRHHSLVNQYNVPAVDTPRRASAPASSYSITNSNSCALNKAHLKLNGDLMDMIVNWSMPEWHSGRRLVQFWRHTNTSADGNLSLVECGFEPMDQQVYHQQRMRDNVAAVAAAAAAAVAVSNSPSAAASLNASTSRPTPIVISCIYWRERNDYFITSVDCIYLLESLIGIQFTVEEKNRIRRNLEGFRPLTVSKCKVECADFFKLIMSFPHPKPRNIEKDVKVFAWKTLPHALRKIIRKYTPSYIISTPLEPIQQQQQQQQQAHNRPMSTATGGNTYAPSSHHQFL